MANYMLIYREKPDAWSSAPGPEEMKAWENWFKKIQAEGSMVEMGAPYASEAKVVTQDATTDEAPTSAGNLILAGYSIVKADNLDAAAAIAKACPGIQQGCSIEVREIKPGPS